MNQSDPSSTRKKIQDDIVLGFAGCCLLNMAAFEILNAGSLSQFTPLLFLFNIGGVFILAMVKRTRWFALGALIAIAFGLFMALLFGMLFNALCARGLTPR